MATNFDFPEYTEFQKYKIYYESMLRVGEEYQDFLTQFLPRYGIIPQFFSSKKYQYAKGEGHGSLEVKFDMMFSDTGNVWIETHEKSHPTNQEYVESGILRNDEAMLYGIGNYHYFFYIFEKAPKGLTFQF